MSGEKLKPKPVLLGFAAVVAVGVIALIIAVSFGMQRSGDSDNEPLSPALPNTRAGAALPGATPEDLSHVHCGVERWPVKTLTDQDTGTVDFTPQATTIDVLRALPTVSDLKPYQNRRLPAELHTYTVTAAAVEWKAEADGDIHMVIADANHHTMIVEFPDAAHCVQAAPAIRQQMAAARAAAIAAFGQPSSTDFQRLSGTVTVTGVAFMDFLHGQAGVAPNGVELHPVLDFRKN